ncbi:MAG: AAA family ATPase [Planctomycetaceae bacterium]|jgi:AAA15 family ATPase/GTPase|nr:AAA family ATPase [Planctomycetaceae bacterium]
MSAIITDMYIKTFRGISELRLSDLGSVNLIVGDNNCGKTSLLESIRIVCSDPDITNIAYLALQRDRVAPSIFRTNRLVSLRTLLTAKKTDYVLDIEAIIKKQEKRQIVINAKKNEKIVNHNNFKSKKNIKISEESEEEIEVLSGKITGIKTTINNKQKKTNEKLFEFHKYSEVQKLPQNDIHVEFLNSTDHLGKHKFFGVHNKDLKNTIDLLQLFDPNIKDLRIDIDDKTHSQTWIVEDQHGGFLPLAAFGDGTKKIISFAEIIASMNDGILLIDEFEMSIHSRAMESVFGFLIKACKSKGIQLFLTTHSIEALDKIIKCCENSNSLDELKIITLTRNELGAFAIENNGINAKKFRFDNEAELR